MSDHNNSKSLSRERYGRLAQGYVDSPTHARGSDLDRLIEVVAPCADWVALDYVLTFRNYRIFEYAKKPRDGKAAALRLRALVDVAEVDHAFLEDDLNGPVAFIIDVFLDVNTVYE